MEPSTTTGTVVVVDRLHLAVVSASTFWAGGSGQVCGELAQVTTAGRIRFPLASPLQSTGTVPSDTDTVVLAVAISPQWLPSISSNGSGEFGVVKTAQVALPPLAAASVGSLASSAMKTPTSYRVVALIFRLTVRSALNVVPATQLVVL